MSTLLAYLPTALTFFAVLAVLILAHEFGHYLLARLFKIDVEEFGIGFPPRLAGWKRGSTVWSLNWIPLGGFVRIKGEDGSQHDERGSFSGKPLYARAAVIAAGVAMNLVLAGVVFTGAFMIGIPHIAEDLPPGTPVQERLVQIMEVRPGSPAEVAGFRLGDAIASLDGFACGTITCVQERVNSSGPEGVAVAIRRGSSAFTRTVVPRLDPDSGRRVMGVTLAETAVVSYPFHVAAWKGIGAVGFYVREIFATVFDMVRGLFAERKTAVDFSGPVGIAVLTGRMAKLGPAALLQFVGLLSVNLAVVNFLPIPALDGGRLLFIVIERLRGRAIRPKLEALMHRLAFFLLLGLVLLVTVKDIGQYREQILRALNAIFGAT